MPDEILKKIAPLIKKIAVSVKQAINAEGINIGMNNEPVAGQIVPHAHFHIIPRFPNDGHKHWKGGSYAKNKLLKTAKKIRKNIKINF